MAEAAHKVVQEAKNAGVWVFGGGVERQRASVVATDGVVTDGPYPETKAVIGGFSIIDVPSREEALAWAAKAFTEEGELADPATAERLGKLLDGYLDMAARLSVTPATGERRRTAG